MQMLKNKKGQFAIGATAIAAILGMIWRFGERFLPGGDIIKIVSNLIVATAIILLAFGAIFSQVGLGLLTGNAILAWIFFLGVGYAAANLIADIVGL